MVAILVALTILVCITIDAYLQWSRARKLGFEPASVQKFKPFTSENVALPAGVFVAPGHTWVEVSRNGGTHIGVDDFLTKVVGRVDGIELPVIGREVRQGDPLFSITQGDRKIDFPAPVDGTVNSVNESLRGTPELTKISPYKHGWVCDITPKNLAKNIKQFAIAEEALARIKSEITRFYDFIALRPLENAAGGYVLQDGGVPACGVLEFLDNETWNNFAAQFIGTQSQ